MAYSPTTWVEDVTTLGPTNLNKLELGLQAAAAVADAAGPGSEIGYDEVAAPVTVSSGTEATGTTVITCAAHTFDGAAVIAEFFCPFASVGSNDTIIVSLFEGATQLGRIAAILAGAVAIPACALVGKLRFTPSAASHTYKVTAHRTTNVGVLAAGAGSTGAYVPMFIRFVKV